MPAANFAEYFAEVRRLLGAKGIALPRNLPEHVKKCFVGRVPEEECAGTLFGLISDHEAGGDD
ncbi:MAG TPA: hypothetical protein VGI39_17225 [Polyangiaceae bacterium]|jgi:hypothetical protein